MAKQSKTRAEWIAYADELATQGDFKTANKIRANLGMEPLVDTTAPASEPESIEQAQPEAAADDGYDWSGLSRTFGQGGTFGFGDEMSAWVQSKLLGPEWDYETLVGDERADIESFRRENPKTALAAELAGGVAGAGGLLGAGRTALASAAGRSPAVFQGLQRLGQTAQRLPASVTGPGAVLVGGGAVGGGIEGAGRSEAETTGELLSDIGEGAAYGATLTPLFAGGTRLAGGVIDNVRRAVQPAFRSARENARAQLGRLLSAEGVEPEQIMGRLRDINPEESALIDLSRQTQELGGAARAESDVAGRRIDEFLEARQGRAPERIRSYMEEASGATRGDADRSRTVLQEEMQRIGTEEYPAVKKIPISPENELQAIMETPYVAPLVNNVRKGFQTEYLSKRDPFTPIQADNTVQLRMYDAVKRAIDERMIELDEAIKKNARQSDKNEARQLGKVRNRLVELLDKQVDPGADVGRYQRVRGLYEEQARKHGALESGSRLAKTRDKALDDMYEQVMGVQGTQLRTDYDRIMSEGGILPPRLRIDQMRPDEMPLFRQGALESMSDAVGKGGPYSNIGARMIRDDDAMTRLRLLSESDEAAGRLEGQLGGEAEMFQSMGFVNPQTGSRTAVLEAAQERAEEAAQNVGALATSAVTGDATGMVARVVNQLRRAWTPEVANEMAELLTNNQITLDDIRMIMAQRDISPETKRRVADLAQRFARTEARQQAGREAAR